jgi:hypothetical protein
MYCFYYFQDKVVQYNSMLVSKGVEYLEEKWGTKRLSIPKHMEAPCLRIVYLPYIFGFSDRLVSSFNEPCHKAILLCLTYIHVCGAVQYVETTLNGAFAARYRDIVVICRNRRYLNVSKYFAGKC